MKDSRIPLYLITGFLDSGKTTLLTDTLNMEYFNDGQRTVLLMCEDGEEEYDQQQLSHRNCRLIPIENQEQLNTAFLQEIDRRYQPERVLMEYNGMWPIQILRDLKLPKNWGLYQAIDVIDEAGALLNNDGQDIYVTEAVNALVRHMELEQHVNSLSNAFSFTIDATEQLERIDAVYQRHQRQQSPNFV